MLIGDRLWRIFAACRRIGTIAARAKALRRCLGSRLLVLRFAIVLTWSLVLER